jgi:hypothetical protein
MHGGSISEQLAYPLPNVLAMAKATYHNLVYTGLSPTKEGPLVSKVQLRNLWVPPQHPVAPQTTPQPTESPEEHAEIGTLW